MTWLRRFHNLGLTNLSDSEVDQYELVVEMRQIEYSFNGVFPWRTFVILVVTIGFFILVSSLCNAAPPIPKITGPATASAGDIVVLDGSATTGAMASLWVAPPSVQLLQSPLRKAAFIAPSVPVQFQLITSNADGITIAYHDFYPAGPQPPVPTPPQPPIPPQPPVPPPTPPVPPTPPTPPQPDTPSVFGLRDKVTTWTRTVSTVNRVNEGKALVAALRGLSGRLAGSEFNQHNTPYKLAQAMLTELKRVNTAALGASADEWQAKVAEQMIPLIQSLYLSSKINTAAQWSGLIAEVADGVERGLVP